MGSTSYDIYTHQRFSVQAKSFATPQFLQLLFEFKSFINSGFLQRNTERVAENTRDILCAIEIKYCIKNLSKHCCRSSHKSFALLFYFSFTFCFYSFQTSSMRLGAGAAAPSCEATVWFLASNVLAHYLAVGRTPDQPVCLPFLFASHHSGNKIQYSSLHCNIVLIMHLQYPTLPLYGQISNFVINKS